MEEANESPFWLESILDEQVMKTNLLAPLLNEAKELKTIFYAFGKQQEKTH